MSRTTTRFFARWFDREAFTEESKTTRLMNGRKRPKGPEDAATVRMPGRRRGPRKGRRRSAADTALDIPLDRPFLVDPFADETVLKPDPTKRRIHFDSIDPAPLSRPRLPRRSPPDMGPPVQRRWTAWRVIPLGVLLGLITGGVLSAVILVLARIFLG